MTISDRFNLSTMTGMLVSTWVPVVCPMDIARACVIFNVDGSATPLLISTDSEGSVSVSLAAGASFPIQLTSLVRGWSRGQIVCYVQGAGAQPVLQFTA
jgi:hypothetical protein